MWFSLSAPGRPPTRRMAIASHSSSRRTSPGRSRSTRIAGAAPQRLAQQHDLLEAERVERGDRVPGGGDEPAVLVGGGCVAGAVAPQIDADRAVLVAQQPGQRVEHPGAEAVGVEQHERRSVATPVEGADREPVVLDRHPLRVVRGLHHHDW